jgi:hypothetical protein
MVPQRKYESRGRWHPLADSAYVVFATMNGRDFPVIDALGERFGDLLGRDDTDILLNCRGSITVRIEVCRRVLRIISMAKRCLVPSGPDTGPGVTR